MWETLEGLGLNCLYLCAGTLLTSLVLAFPLALGGRWPVGVTSMDKAMFIGFMLLNYYGIASIGNALMVALKKLGKETAVSPDAGHASQADTIEALLRAAKNR